MAIERAIRDKSSGRDKWNQTRLRGFSRAFLQPFVAYAISTKATLTVNLESTYDWNAGQWTVSVNFMVSQASARGASCISACRSGARYYVEGLRSAPDWGYLAAVSIILLRAFGQALCSAS